MITVYSERALPDGKVKRRYEVTLTDLLGNTHTQIVGMFNHDQSNTGAEIETQLLESKRAQEIDTYRSEIEMGNNPFLTDSLWNTRTTLLYQILNVALVGKSTDPIVYNGLPFLALVSDAELMTLFGEDQAWVDGVRSKAQALMTGKAAFDGYVPILIGG